MAAKRCRPTLHHCTFFAVVACLVQISRFASGFSEAHLISSRPRKAPRIASAGQQYIYVSSQSAQGSRRLGTGAIFQQESDSTEPVAPTLEKYEFDGWTCSYLYKPASPGHELDVPLLLIHPVGIGLSSWFWEKFIDSWKGGAVYAPDLIGCGLENGSDAWDPESRGLFVPIGWVKWLEAFIQDKMREPQQPQTEAGAQEKSRRLLGQFRRMAEANLPPRQEPPPCAVVAQGGCAPVAVMLASRNPESVVSKVVLTSPPTWDDMTTAVPESELDRNYNFFRSDPWGKLAFNVLESPWAVRTFSNLFLFEDECDELWVDKATRAEAAAVEARPPVMVFNSGMLNHRSYEKELKELVQPTLIVSGSDDTSRAENRRQYLSEMKNCTLTSVKGLNVVPWENPAEACQAIHAFLSYSNSEKAMQ